MEKEPQPKFIIERMTLDTIDQANAMRLQSWLDTYVNNEAGVTREWIEERNARSMSPEKLQERRERFVKADMPAWVAISPEGQVIGCTTPYVDTDGHQHVGSLYTDKEWLGSGIGSALMQKVIEWADSTKPLELGVVSYNERAKAFYKKWGFVEIPDSETLFANTIPEIKMVRKGDAE